MKCDESLVFVVTKVVSNQFKAINKIFLSTVVITKNNPSGNLNREQTVSKAH